jgi:hypothetical protein
MYLPVSLFGNTAQMIQLNGGFSFVYFISFCIADLLSVEWWFEPCVSFACLVKECSFSMTLLENSLFYTIYKADYYCTINCHTSNKLMFHLSWWKQVVVRGLWRSKLHSQMDEWICLCVVEFLTFIPSPVPVDYIKFPSEIPKDILFEKVLNYCRNWKYS